MKERLYKFCFTVLALPFFMAFLAIAFVCMTAGILIMGIAVLFMPVIALVAPQAIKFNDGRDDIFDSMRVLHR